MRSYFSGRVISLLISLLSASFTPATHGQSVHFDVALDESGEMLYSSGYSREVLYNFLKRGIQNQEAFKLGAGNSQFIIRPKLDIISRDVTPTAPPMIGMSIDLTLSFENNVNGTVFHTQYMPLKGVGTNDNKAFVAAFKSIIRKREFWNEFEARSVEEVSNYYSENCDRILSEAETNLSVDNFDQALLDLFSVPAGVTPCYDMSRAMVADAYVARNNRRCHIYLSLAQTAIAAGDYQAATDALLRIDPQSECADQVAAVRDQMGAEVNNLFERRWAIYENQLANQHELQSQRIQAAETIYSSLAQASTGNSQRNNSGDVNISIGSAQQRQEPNQENSLQEETSARSSNDAKEGFEIISPVSKRLDETIYTHEAEIDVYGLLTNPNQTESLFINEFKGQWDDNGAFRQSIKLKPGTNSIRIKWTSQNQNTLQKSLTIERVEKATDGHQPESALVPIEKQKRIALIIGNARYKSVSPLENPVNDATDMARSLKELGFEVNQLLDASLQQMREGLTSFSKKMREADVALFFFAGHGLEIEGDNFLVPVDAMIDSKEDVFSTTLEVDHVLRAMEYSNSENLNILILDACRNNPFPTGKRGGGGLAGVAPPSGTIIAYATEPGATASDGNSGNGLYTGELVRQISIPQRIEDVFMNTRNEVERKSNGAQQPWETARLKGVFYLKRDK